jgi:tetratricopeptide (TPR) repeat protein
MLRLIFLLIALIALRDPLQAQSDDAKNCAATTERNDFDLAIDHCTAALQSGQLLDQDLAVIFNNRGLAYYNKKDYDQAIRDYDRAIGLQPNYSPAFVRRATTYQEKRQYERALADYEAATQVDPKFASERPKAFLFFYLGHMTQSAEMF